MKKNVLAVQSFGRENEYRRVVLTILSFYAFVEDKETPTLLFTDNPGWFTAVLQGLPIQYVHLTPEKIKDMRGKIDFLHRMKIALIEEAFGLFPESNIYYADSDTFYTTNPETIMREISSDVSSMHLLEYSFGSMKDFELPNGKSFLDFYHLINTKTFVAADGQEVSVRNDMNSWNAGIMFFHSQHKRFIPDVFALTDQFFPDTQHHASEQYAFSVILQNNTKLIPSESVNYHYWYRIKKVIADEFLEKHINKAFTSLTLKEKLEEVRGWTVVLPGIFDTHIWMTRDNAIQAFNVNNFFEGYKWAIKALLQKKKDSIPFIKDVLYHLKRQIRNRDN